MSRASGATPSETAIQGRARQILLSFTLMTIPMTLFSAVLLGLIFHYRIAGTDSSKASFLVDGASLDTDAIYVDLSATALTTVASWCSTVSPLLLTFALTLASYPAARSLFLGSQNAQDQRLPTPYQFALMLRITSNPSIASLWDWLVYSFAWSSRRSSQATPVKVMGWVLMLGSLLRFVELMSRRRISVDILPTVPWYSQQIHGFTSRPKPWHSSKANPSHHLSMLVSGSTRIAPITRTPHLRVY